MEETNQNTDEKIDLLQKQVDQLQLKVFEERKSKWYKNPSMLLSILALTSSLTFSIITIVDKELSREAEKESGTLSLIRTSIEELVEEENKYLQINSNPSADMATKNNAGMIFQAKSGYLIDKILASMNEKNMDQLEPNLLLNCGRFLCNSGKFEKAIESFNTAIDNSQDSLTIGICYRSLANIYANTTYTGFDSLKSRAYRSKDIKMSEVFNGDAKNDYLSRSYELWALDEYYFLNNQSVGNRLIDSAKFYVGRLSDFHQNKASTITRLNEVYNYYNKIVSAQ